MVKQTLYMIEVFAILAFVFVLANLKAFPIEQR
jgi:hypothetical protein